MHAHTPVSALVYTHVYTHFHTGQLADLEWMSVDENDLVGLLPEGTSDSH